jgi:hypothetical protein
MKKVLLVAVLLAAVVATVFVVVSRTLIHHPRAAELVPAETILFAQLPDTWSSARRFKQTALWRIIQEPEMQEVFASSETKSPLVEEWKRLGGLVAGTKPREAFVAVTSIDGAVPTFVAGFAFSGWQKHAEELAAEWRKAVRKTWPTGQSELTSYGRRDIETFTTKDFVLAEVFTDGWYFIADDLALLECTLDRLDQKSEMAGTSLAESDLFKRAIAPLPPAPEALFVAQIETLAERLDAVLVASGQKTAPRELDELKKVQAVAAATKFDGANCRDAIFVLRTGGVPQAPLARHALALSSPATLIYYAMALPASLEVSEESQPILAMIPGWDAFNQALTSENLTLADLPKAFGPEFGSLVDWPQDAEQPSVLLAIDIRDQEKAAAFVKILTGGALGDFVWEQRQEAGATLFTMGTGESDLLSPTVAMGENFLLAGFNTTSVMQGLAHLQSRRPGLEATPEFSAIGSSVIPPTAGFGYIDFKTLFERGYRSFKSALGVGLAFSDKAGQYLDAGKLPPASTISQHLGPIAYSQANTERGTLIESAGPLTFNQVLAVVAAGAVATALPAMDAVLTEGGSFDPGKLLKGLNPNSGSGEPVTSDSVDMAPDGAVGK